VIAGFARADIYNAHFFDTGPLVALYNAARLIIIVVVAWLVYAVGAGTLVLAAGRTAVAALPPGERYALGFFAGTGVWHLGLMGLGFAGDDTFPIALALTAAIIALSGSHLLSCLGEARRQLPAIFKRSTPLGRRNVVYLLIFAVVAALFLCIKVLYPNGSNDYYDHYFYYYERVVQTGSLMPNDVWYHFYYSKGAGLFFLTMVLTDPLAPQLVAAAFIGAGALTVAVMLNRVASDSGIGWVGAIFYGGLLIFTPNPPDLVGAAGWAELAKIHELSAVTFLGVFWTSLRLADSPSEERPLWLCGLASAVLATVLLTTVMAAVVGAYLGVLAVAGLAMRRMGLAFGTALGAGLAGMTAVAVMAINYWLTGIPTDLLLLALWRFVDLEKVQRWGVLSEVLWQHLGMTGYNKELEPIGWHLMRLIGQDLRLSLWWPLFAFAAGGLGWTIWAGDWRGRFTRPSQRVLLLAGTAFAVSFLIVAVGLGAARRETASFYRLSTFAYGPVLCTALLLVAAYDYRSRAKAAVSALVIGAIVLSGEFGKHGRMMLAGVPMLTGDAVSFAIGRFSIADAYRHPGWPGRLPWGGIYPGMEAAWRIAGRGTPIYSLHNQAYCMLPDCRMLSWLNTRATPDTDAALFGTPEEGEAAFKRAGINYFFYSKELGAQFPQISTPLVLSQLLAPDTIADHLAIRWTDGTSYLLTWRGADTRPIDSGFLDTYRAQVAASGIASSFPLAQWRSIYAHFRDKGMHPYRLPWCRSCDGIPAD